MSDALLDDLVSLGEYLKKHDKKLDNMSGYVLPINIEGDKVTIENIEEITKPSLLVIVPSSGSNGPNPTPYAKLNDVHKIGARYKRDKDNVLKDIEKKVKNRLSKWTNKSQIAEVNIKPEYLKMFKRFDIKRYAPAILNKVINVNQDINQNLYIVLKIAGHWPSEYLKEAYMEEITSKGSAGELVEGYCSVCGKRGMVYPDGLSHIGLRFYTKDKRSFLPQWGYHTEFGVCGECLSKINVALKWVNKYGKLTIGGNIKSYILPSRSYVGASNKNTNEMWEVYTRYMEQNNEVSDIGDELADIVLNTKGSFPLDIVITKSEQKKMTLLGMWLSLSPSWIKEVNFQWKEIIKQYNTQNQSIVPILKDILYGFEHTTAKSGGNLIWAKIINYLSSIYLKENIVYNELILNAYKSLDKAWAEQFRANDRYSKFKRISFSSQLFISFLRRINLLKEVGTMDDESKNALELLGQFVMHTINMQQQAGKPFGSEPLRKQLRSLYMDAKRVHWVFARTFEDYQVYLQLLDKPIPFNRLSNLAKLLDDMDDKLSKYPPSELTYYFAVGLAKYKYPKRGEKDE